jgi:hypothetical protein
LSGSAAVEQAAESFGFWRGDVAIQRLRARGRLNDRPMMSQMGAVVSHFLVMIQHKNRFLPGVCDVLAL